MFGHLARAHFRIVLGGASMAALSLAVGPSWAQEQSRDFDISAQPLASALVEYSRQSGIVVVVPADLTAGKRAPAVKGVLAPDVALSRLLVGSDLNPRQRPEGGLTLVSAPDQTRPNHLGAAEPAASSETSADTVIVTGSRIRGGNPTAPVHVIDREEIDESGYSQIGDLVRSLPENWSGGQNPGVTSAGGAITNQNITNGTSVNLRGLGADATLVMLNGHRIGADGFTQGSDISGVPLSAVERIEVVPDGASALYGSDAVAGVVNMILRKNFTGLETSARVGVATQGGGQEQTYNVLSGVSADSWHVLANLEYAWQDNIRAGERDVTANMHPAYTLRRAQARHSLFVAAGADLSDRLTVSLDMLVNDRDSKSASQATTAPKPTIGLQYTPAYNLAANVDYKISDDWTLRAVGVASASRTDYRQRLASGASVQTRYKNVMSYGEATVDGTAFRGPTGDIKAAFGGGYREESFATGLPTSASYQNNSRNVTYGYAELFAPLIASSEARPGLNELELSLSARAEKYNDIGSSTSPKVGLRYVPFHDLTVRGTWGKSFKAPSLLQEYSTSSAYLYAANNFGGLASNNVILTYGGNTDLKPEKSDSWTIGMDYTPASSDDLSISWTYFDIDYKDRVIQPIANIGAALTDPLYAPFAERNPSPSRQAAIIGGLDEFLDANNGQVLTPTGYDTSSVVAILYDQYINATAQQIRGLDIAYRQSFATGVGELSPFANASLLEVKQQTISTAPSVELSGRIYYVPEFRARGGLNWSLGDLTATTVVNYVSGEIDTGLAPNRHVASWTTVDATVAYTLPETIPFLKDVRLALSASNLFDKDPPHLYSPSATLPHFDSTNTSVVGRFVSLTVSKAW